MRKKDYIKIKTGINFNIILLILIPAILIGTTVAKYIDEHNFEETYKSNIFYFNSDLLSDAINQPEYNYSQGTDTISFYLKNNEDSLRYSEVDIKYIVEVTKDDVIVDTKEGVIAKNDVNLEKIEFTNLLAGEYIVTAKAISPYEKILSAKFNITGKNESIEYEISDVENSSVIELTVKTKEYGGNIIITFPTGVVPDETDPKLTTITTSSATAKFEENSSYTFIFFKVNPANVYVKSDFSVQ